MLGLAVHRQPGFRRGGLVEQDFYEFCIWREYGSELSRLATQTQDAENKPHKKNKDNTSHQKTK